MFLKSNPKISERYNSVKSDAHTRELIISKAKYEKLDVHMENLRESSGD